MHRHGYVEDGHNHRHFIDEHGYLTLHCDDMQHIAWDYAVVTTTYCSA